MKPLDLSIFLISALTISLSGQKLEPAADTSLEELDALVVTGKAEKLVGSASTASKGQASFEELSQRPYLRRGELLAVVPGVVITQHSGDGKANQYFVRGFNLDHGTDFNISMDGQPINFASHAHGQGYADINPIIPELVQTLDYWKGPFHGQLGDFSTAGAAKFRFVDMLPQGIALFGFGQNNYYRGLIADTIDLSTPPVTSASGIGAEPLRTPTGDRSGLTYALEYNYYDGPWIQKGNAQRMNGFLKYFHQSGPDTFSLTAQAYDADWDSTDQIPQRLISSGGINRLGNVDDTVGGESSRYSLMGAWDQENPNGNTHADFYVGKYNLDLLSNFTYGNL
jgi:hypothetical protein